MKKYEIRERCTVEYYWTVDAPSEDEAMEIFNAGEADEAGDSFIGVIEVIINEAEEPKNDTHSE
jgi:hypothetical protein